MDKDKKDKENNRNRIIDNSLAGCLKKYLKVDETDLDINKELQNERRKSDRF